LIKNGKDINIFEDGLESRDFVFIDDVVDATILGLEKSEANGEVFNVGTGEPVNVITVSNELIKNYGTQTKVNVSGNYRLGDIRHNYADLTKIKEMLGFEPKYDFGSGIKMFTKWVLTQEIKVSKYEESIAEMKEKGLFK
jgi:dTDP-L-rhamnose 4-epimerase